VPREFEHLLRDGGCPACSYVEEAERSFFTWFAIESSSTAEMRAQLRAAMGMCPTHSRRLLEAISEGHVMTTVMREALAGARQWIGGNIEPGTCPACAAAQVANDAAVQLVLDSLRDRAMSRLYYEHSGMCTMHVIRAFEAAEAPVLEALGQRLRATLAETDDEDRLLQMLAGSGRDSPGRMRWRAALPDEPEGQSTIDELCRRLTLEACPVCLAGGWIERRFLEWFVERSRAQDPSIETDPGELCATHLHDLALADRVAALRAAQAKRTARTGELRRLVDDLSKLEPTGPSEKSLRRPTRDQSPALSCCARRSASTSAASTSASN
jgi:hypothetical protein